MKRKLGGAERVKALRAFGRARPNWRVLAAAKCPVCNQPDFCEKHFYVNEVWLTGGGGAMMYAMAMHDAKLWAEMQAHGL